MSSPRIADLFRVRSRFLRSAHLERDFEDPKALEGYVLTPQASTYLDRMADGLAPRSGQRAWRVTGDYGVGKSSFALVLAHLLGGRLRGLPPAIATSADRARAAAGRKPRLLPILVTGSREPASTAVLRALARVIEPLHSRGRRPKILDRLRGLLRSADNPTISTEDAAVVKAVEDAAAFVRTAGHGTGLLLVLDELGKFLEFAAARPDCQRRLLPAAPGGVGGSQRRYPAGRRRPAPPRVQRVRGPPVGGCTARVAEGRGAFRRVIVRSPP